MLLSPSRSFSLFSLDLMLFNSLSPPLSDFLFPMQHLLQSYFSIYYDLFLSLVSSPFFTWIHPFLSKSFFLPTDLLLFPAASISISFCMNSLSFWSNLTFQAPFISQTHPCMHTLSLNPNSSWFPRFPLSSSSALALFTFFWFFSSTLHLSILPYPLIVLAPIMPVNFSSSSFWKFPSYDTRFFSLWFVIT